MSIAAKLRRTREALADAAERAGRRPSEICLVAVSKVQPAEAIREAYEAGQRHFGENYVQELRRKQDALSDLDIRWHFIGHLQRNKARQVAGRVELVETVDSAKLLAELDKRAEAAGKAAQVLLQVNISGEASKSGCSPEELRALLDAARSRSFIQPMGLMTIPPFFGADPAQSRHHFAALRTLRDEHGGEAALPELSMGMSGDYEVAIAEGATIVRVGTAIFGARG